ncbi:inosine-uridine preferring nucleoside hydrolase family protein [Striga hermonthica]|uniref:Inosine-uridine preferring nucleoside hydrolase family protein n=1 Tax=Striga hermonthica TaxID=68872 RepID=A0A9N7R1Y2_STRHE|nr:inosine-uridine preferring nucleoside hydrolase family protein [Striga hermonthica]
MDCTRSLSSLRGRVDERHREQYKGNVSWTAPVFWGTEFGACLVGYCVQLEFIDRSVRSAVTINSNAWTNAGHAVNQVYDLLYMMGRDDVAVGVGGEGSILEDGTILPNVGGYLPIIEQQGNGTAGYCRYRQAIPVGFGGRLDIDTNYGFRRSFLPQGNRGYSPARQPTAQQVMVDKITAGPITVFIIGASTNFAIFLMTNPELKKNIKHIYIMGGGVRSKNPTGCCPKNSRSFCQPRQCGDRGNLFTDYTSNPYAEFNMFGDPFAAYQKNQRTYEAQYCFRSLKIARDTWFDDQFFMSYFMWDSFLSGVATSIMLKENNSNGENEFAEMEHMNITVVTSNEPYGISDGSNPFFDGLKKPKFNLKKNGVHSGHVYARLRDPFCITKNGKGRCKDGYTQEVTGREGVHVLVAVKAKPNREKSSSLNREFFRSFLDVLNREKQTGKFNFTTQFPHYHEVIYKPDFSGRRLGKSVVFDMDMSAGDFLALLYLLKVPVELVNLKSNPNFPPTGDCKYNKAIPHGAGGFLDSDTLYGLARDLPRSPRRYTAENSMKFGAPRDTDHPELRQPLALEVWQSVIKSLDSGSGITILTNGPLTTVAQIILSDKKLSSIQDIIVVGGHIGKQKKDKGNAINIPTNRYAELNMFLDPLAAKTVFSSGHNVTLIPLNVQRKVCGFRKALASLYRVNKTPEALFARRLLSTLHQLKEAHRSYQHMDIFLGEILGAVIVGGGNALLNTSYALKNIEVLATVKALQRFETKKTKGGENSAKPVVPSARADDGSGSRVKKAVVEATVAIKSKMVIPSSLPQKNLGSRTKKRGPDKVDPKQRADSSKRLKSQDKGKAAEAPRGDAELGEKSTADFQQN